MSYNLGVTPVSISNYNPEFVILKRTPQVVATPQNMPLMPAMTKNPLNNYSVDNSYSNKGINYIVNSMKFNTTTDTYNSAKDYTVDTTNKNIDYLINYVAEKK